MQLNVLKNTSHHLGFTLMEVMIVSIIVAIISGFALPNFTLAMTKARVRDAQTQLSAVYASFKILSAKNPNDPRLSGFKTIAQINADLNINLVANGLTYSYNGTPPTFTANAIFPGGFNVQMTQSPINPLTPPATGGNPCCVTAGTCGTALGGC